MSPLRRAGGRFAPWIVAGVLLSVAGTPRSAAAQDGSASASGPAAGGGATVLTRRLLLSATVGPVATIEDEGLVPVEPGPGGPASRFRATATVRANVPSRLWVSASVLDGRWMLRWPGEPPRAWDGTARTLGGWLPAGRHTVVWELDAAARTAVGPVLRYEVETAGPSGDPPSGARTPRLR